MPFIGVGRCLRCPDIPKPNITVLMTCKEFISGEIYWCCYWIFCQNFSNLPHFLDIYQFHWMVWRACNDSVLRNPIHTVDSFQMHIFTCNSYDRFLIQMSLLFVFLRVVKWLILSQKVLGYFINRKKPLVSNSTKVPITKRICIDS